MRLSVVIPSLLRGSLEPAVGSIRAQTALANGATVEIVVGIDAGARIPEGLQQRLGVRFQESSGRSQAAALNAAARSIEGDFVAFLEDDDRWDPQFLEAALQAFGHGVDFVSSTTLQVDDQDEIICIGDFPIPSGWIMRRAVWKAVGGFNESYRWHLDNEWLGRLGDAKIPRGHLVEATAPITPQAARQVRPQLDVLMTHGGPAIRLFRHRSPYPLVRRLVHPNSGMAKIATQTTAAAERAAEYARLGRTFGRIPW